MDSVVVLLFHFSDLVPRYRLLNCCCRHVRGNDNNNVINTKTTYVGTQTTLTISTSITKRYYLGHQETHSERTKYEEIWSSTSTVRFSSAMSCEEKGKWWDIRTVVRLEYAKVLNMISVKLRMQFKWKRAHESIIRDCYTDSQCNPPVSYNMSHQK